jgi:hypothetical protein
VLSFFFELGASCIRPVYYGLRPFAPFEYTLLIKKKKKKYRSSRFYSKNLITGSFRLGSQIRVLFDQWSNLGIISNANKLR